MLYYHFQAPAMTWDKSGEKKGLKNQTETPPVT